jgi:hypothetical protein
MIPTKIFCDERIVRRKPPGMAKRFTVAMTAID